MLNIQRVVIEHFIKELQGAYSQTYSILEPQYGNMIEWAGYERWKTSTPTPCTTMWTTPSWSPWGNPF